MIRSLAQFKVSFKKTMKNFLLVFLESQYNIKSIDLVYNVHSVYYYYDQHHNASIQAQAACLMLLVGFLHHNGSYNCLNNNLFPCNGKSFQQMHMARDTLKTLPEIYFEQSRAYDTQVIILSIEKSTFLLCCWLNYFIILLTLIVYCIGFVL